MWHRQGKINVTKGSDIVTGTNTGWVENIRVGDAFQGPDGKLYQVINVASNEALAISPAYEGNTATNLNYWVVPIPGYSKVQADRLSLIISKLDGDIVTVTEAAEQAVSAAQQTRQWRDQAANSAAEALTSEQHTASLVDEALSSKQAAELAAAKSEAARDHSESAADEITEVAEIVLIKAGEVDAHAGKAANSAAAASQSENNAKTSEGTAKDASTSAQTDAALAHDSKNLAVTAAQAAERARDDAVAVTTGGDATLDPEPGKIPLARATGAIDQGWVHGLEYELDQLRLLRNQIKYGDGPYPVLDFQFAGARYLDPRITFERVTPDWDWSGNEYAIDEPVVTEEGLWVAGRRVNINPHSHFSASQWAAVRANKEILNDGFTRLVSTNTEPRESYLRCAGYLVDEGITYTVSAIVREGSAPYCAIRNNKSDGFMTAVFDLQAMESTNFYQSGAVSYELVSSSISKTDLGVLIQYTFTATEAWSGNLYVYASNNPESAGAPENGMYVDALSMQLEEGMVATPHIPTNGSQVTVARNFVSFKMPALSHDFSVLYDGTGTPSTSRYNSYFSLYEGVDRRLRLMSRTDFNDVRLSGRTAEDGVTSDLILQWGISESLKIAFSYSKDRFLKAAIHGSVTSYSVTPHADFSGVDIFLGTFHRNQETATEGDIIGFIRQIHVYSSALSDDQLLELTS